MEYKNKISIKNVIIILIAFVLICVCLFLVIKGCSRKLKADEEDSKETLYLVKIDDYDFWAEGIKTYNQEYTGQISGQNVSVKEFITISENNKCYYSDQIKFNNGAITTIQGNCTYSKNDNKLAVDGVYNRLDVPSTIEQNHGVPSTNSKEEAHLDFEIGSNGKYMKAKNITYYNSFYVMMSERESEYILVDKNNQSYDLNGKSIRKIYNKVTDESEYVTLDLNQYNIIEK